MQGATATKDVHFSADAEFSSRYEGAIHPVSHDRWRQVDPLESLAGSHPVNNPHRHAESEMKYGASVWVRQTNQMDTTQRAH